MTMKIFFMTRNVIGLVLSGFVLMSFIQNISAQNKTFTEKELEILKQNVADKLETISYRSVSLENNGINERKTIFEFVPPNRKHIVVTIPDENFYEEWIYIGYKMFYRDNAKGKWKKNAPFEATVIGSSNGEPPTITKEYKLTPNQIVNQIESDLYEVITTYRYSGKPDPFVYQEKYWINKNGLFAKTHFLSSVSEETIDYEYGLNIKIQAPIIRKPKKKK